MARMTVNTIRYIHNYIELKIVTLLCHIYLHYVQFHYANSREKIFPISTKGNPLFSAYSDPNPQLA